MASYGGFSVCWLAGHNDGRYAALVAHAGIFNVEAQYLETEEMWFADFDLGGPYWDKENAVAQRTYANSPHRYVNNWTAPMLITVGELDYRILASPGYDGVQRRENAWTRSRDRWYSLTRTTG